MVTSIITGIRPISSLFTSRPPPAVTEWARRTQSVDAITHVLCAPINERRAGYRQRLSHRLAPYGHRTGATWPLKRG